MRYSIEMRYSVTKTEKVGGATIGIIQLVITTSQGHPMTPDGL